MLLLLWDDFAAEQHFAATYALPASHKWLQGAAITYKSWVRVTHAREWDVRRHASEKYALLDEGGFVGGSKPGRNK